MNKPEIQGWEHQPPIGGWRISIIIKGENFVFDRGGPRQIVEDIAQLQKKNGVFDGYDKIWKYCNDAWCYKDPKRCLRNTRSEKHEPGYKPPGVRGNQHVNVSPTDYGHRLWEWLNTFGMKGCFNHGEWLMTIRRVTFMLNPRQNPATGCAHCFNEWKVICNKNPPNNVKNSAEAAKWVFEAHNRVNRKIGKPVQNWRTMIRKNAWNIPV